MLSLPQFPALVLVSLEHAVLEAPMPLTAWEARPTAPSVRRTSRGARPKIPQYTGRVIALVLKLSGIHPSLPAH